MMWGSETGPALGAVTRGAPWLVRGLARRGSPTGAECAEPREPSQAASPWQASYDRAEARFVAFRRMRSFTFAPGRAHRERRLNPDRKDGICRAYADRMFRHTGPFGRQP
jgi:hypothetical protein